MDVVTPFKINLYFKQISATAALQAELQRAPPDGVGRCNLESLPQFLSRERHAELSAQTKDRLHTHNLQDRPPVVATGDKNF